MTYDQFIEMIDIISINHDTLSNEKIGEMIGASVEDVAIEREDTERYMDEDCNSES
tara:strand:+ start:282 stop:449 length:168 start_codon:yes stop_codon:yes gene_type:complete